MGRHIIIMEHKNLHTKSCVFTEREVHNAYMHTSLAYRHISKQPVDKQIVSIQPLDRHKSKTKNTKNKQQQVVVLVIGF